MEIKRRKKKKVDPGFGFGREVDKDVDESKGISHDSLVKSRMVRTKFLAEYGFIPCSILKHNPGIKAIDLSRGYVHVRNQTEKHIAKTAPTLGKTGMTTQGYSMPRDGKLDADQEYGSAVLSRFTQNIGSFFVKFYSPENSIVYDPFAGHNSRMQLCFEAGRHYYGCDVSKEFMGYNKKIRKLLLDRSKQGLLTSKDKTPTIKLFHKSSHDIPLEDDFADFTITSPPYWDIEYYGPEKEQLGMCKTYKKFMSLITRHAQENYRILKPGSYCCWFINDFKKDGVFYPYHIDTYQMLVNVGFTPFNIYILELPSITKHFLQWTVKTRVLPKSHEYIVVVKKD